MLARHLTLGIALAALGLAAGSATVLAGDDDARQPLHAERHAYHAPSDDVVIDRSRALSRIDRLLAGVDDLAEDTRTPWRRGVGPLSAQRDDEDPLARRDERPGALPEADVTLSHRGGRHGARGVDRDLYRMRLELLRLRDEIASAPVLRRAPVVVGMPHRAFRDLLREIERSPFVEDKVAVVRDVAGRAHFTSAQAVTVIRAVPSWGQVDVAYALHDRLVDPEGVFRLHAAITFATDRERLRRRIEGRHARHDHGDAARPSRGAHHPPGGRSGRGGR